MPDIKHQLLDTAFRVIHNSLTNNRQDNPLFLCHDYQYLLHYLHFNNLPLSVESEALHKRFLSLVHSGIHDPVEGGFFEVSPDEKHDENSFQKNLASNALFISLFSDYSGYFLDGFFSTPAIRSALWVINRLASVEGGFYQGMASENALKNYYMLDQQILNNTLDPDSRTAFISAYGIHENNLSKPVKLKQARSWKQVSEDTSQHIKQVPLALENALQLLSLARKNNPAPAINHSYCFKDNCRMITSLLKAARQFNRDDFAVAALAALRYLQHHFPPDDSSDCADYLIIIHTLLKRLQYQWDDESYHWLQQLAIKFSRSERADAGCIVQTMLEEKISHSIADFYNLYFLTSQANFLAIAELSADEVERLLQKHSDKSPVLLTALIKTLSKHNIIIIRGAAYETTYWLQQLVSGFQPSIHVYAIANNYQGPDQLRFPAENATKASMYQFKHQQFCKNAVALKTEISLSSLLELTQAQINYS